MLTVYCCIYKINNGPFCQFCDIMLEPILLLCLCICTTLHCSLTGIDMKDTDIHVFAKVICTNLSCLWCVVDITLNMYTNYLPCPLLLTVIHRYI